MNKKHLLNTTAFLVLTIFLSIFMPGCGPSSETIKQNYERMGNLDINPKRQTLETLNRIMLMEGKKGCSEYINTEVYEWYNGAVRAEFIGGINRFDNLIELEIQNTDITFPGSIFGVHLTDSPEKIPEILSKIKCGEFEQSEFSGRATCYQDWRISWYHSKGKLESVRVYKGGYIPYQVNPRPSP